MELYLPIIAFLLILAAFLREDFVFTLLYLLIIAYGVGRWWSRKALQNLKVSRNYPSHTFLGDKIRVDLEITNHSWLPVVWMYLHESLPVDLAVPNSYRQVASMKSRERLKMSYDLLARKRGYYRIGPLMLHSGDILGLSNLFQNQVEPDYLTVYPKIIPLSYVNVPSRSPMGNLRHKQPIFEDPARVLGKRDYVAGDSLRRVDWKASAAVGRMQVKQYEPSIALETSIFLNLNGSDYEQKNRLYAIELAIVVAASMANWVVGQKQSVGLVTNGNDPLGNKGRTQALPPRKGRGHLIRVLEVLARIDASEQRSSVDMIQHAIPDLSWGTTLILISGGADEATFDELFNARRGGLGAMIVLCGPVPGLREIRHYAARFDFPVFHFLNEQDLDIWR